MFTLIAITLGSLYIAAFLFGLIRNLWTDMMTRRELKKAQEKQKNLVDEEGNIRVAPLTGEDKELHSWLLKGFESNIRVISVGETTFTVACENQNITPPKGYVLVAKEINSLMFMSSTGFSDIVRNMLNDAAAPI